MEAISHSPRARRLRCIDAAERWRGKRMACGQQGQLHAPGLEERVWGDEQGGGSLTHERYEDRIDLADAAGVVELDLIAGPVQPVLGLRVWTT